MNQDTRSLLAVTILRGIRLEGWPTSGGCIVQADLGNDIVRCGQCGLGTQSRWASSWYYRATRSQIL